MQMAQIIGGYSLGGADLLRRAMGKKKPEEMAEHRSIFVAGAASGPSDLDDSIAQAGLAAARALTNETLVRALRNDPLVVLLRFFRVSVIVPIVGFARKTGQHRSATVRPAMSNGADKPPAVEFRSVGKRYGNCW